MQVLSFAGEQSLDVKVLPLALPDDYVEHGSVDQLRKETGIDEETIGEENHGRHIRSYRKDERTIRCFTGKDEILHRPEKRQKQSLCPEMCMWMIKRKTKPELRFRRK